MFNTSASVQRPLSRFSVLIRKLQVNAKLGGYTAHYFSRLHSTSWPAQWGTWGRVRGGCENNVDHHNEGLAAGCPPRACLVKMQRSEAYKATPRTSSSANSASSPPSVQTDRQTNWLTSGSVSRPGQVLSRCAADTLKWIHFWNVSELSRVFLSDIRESSHCWCDTRRWSVAARMFQKGGETRLKGELPPTRGKPRGCKQVRCRAPARPIWYILQLLL